MMKTSPLTDLYLKHSSIEVYCMHGFLQFLFLNINTCSLLFFHSASTAAGSTDGLTVGSVTSVGVDINVLNRLDDAFQAVLTFAIPTNSLELDRVRNVTGTVRGGGAVLIDVYYFILL